jgi:NADH:ubiquinone oxidoreductase subunit 3 (subunit A)
MTLDTNLADGNINVIPNETDFNIEPDSIVRLKSSYQFDVIDEDGEPISFTTVLIILAVLALIGFVTYCLTGHAAQDELAKAYSDGYESGADDQALADRESIWELFNDGNITQEQANMLLNEVNQNNDQVKQTFTNPYDLGTNNIWNKLTVQLVTFIILLIIVVVIIVVAVLFYRWYKGRGKSKEKESSGKSESSDKDTNIIVIPTTTPATATA